MTIKLPYDIKHKRMRKGMSEKNKTASFVYPPVTKKHQFD